MRASLLLPLGFLLLSTALASGRPAQASAPVARGAATMSTESPAPGARKAGLRTSALLRGSAVNRTDLRKIGGAGGPNRACRPDYVRPDFAKLRAEYRAALARWQALNLRDYTFEYEEIAAPLRYPATVVTVEGGRLKSVVLKAGELGEPSASARLTMSGRFLETWADLAQAQRWPCPVLEVSYDARYGFPQRRYIGTAEALVADGDAEWRITSFTPLRPVSARP